jgi:hypothetical protein
MRNLLFIVALTIVIALTAVMPARADGGRTNTPGVIPAVLTTQQKADNQHKVALARQTMSRQSTNGVQPLVSGGNAYANLYKEPQATYSLNWCGAGTATVLIAGWQIKTRGYDSIGQYSRYSNPYGAGYAWYSGGDAFMQHLAYDDQAVQDRATSAGITEPSRNAADDYSDETHVASAANIETASMTPWANWYVVWQNMGSLSNFDTALYNDIANNSVPFSAVAAPAPGGGTLPLPGWSGAPSFMRHWLAVGSFDMPNDAIVYGDSAGTQQAYGQDPWYWHNFTRSSFFDTYMLPYLNGAVVW